MLALRQKDVHQRKSCGLQNATIYHFTLLVVIQFSVSCKCKISVSPEFLWCMYMQSIAYTLYPSIYTFMCPYPYLGALCLSSCLDLTYAFVYGSEPVTLSFSSAETIYRQIQTSGSFFYFQVFTVMIVSSMHIAFL